MKGDAYPVQFFSCRDSGQSPEEMQETLARLARLSREAGPVAGETGIPGLRLDFNGGVRVRVPAGNWRLTIGDYDSGMVFYDQAVSETVVTSVEQYYIRWQIEVARDGETVFTHVFDPAGQKIRLVFLSWLLGDMQTFLSYVPYVRDVFRADVYYSIHVSMQEVARRLFPDIRCRNEAEEDTYATYYFHASLGAPGSGAPLDGRMIPMLRTGQVILGLPTPPPKIPWPAGPRRIKEPYVCIGVQASSVGKGWLWPDGWDEITAYVKSLGYRVLCIDKEKRLEKQGYVLEMPEGAEDFTGDVALLERADMLHHAECFIGLPSGLSWLAYTADCPVVMIGGFSLYWHEFPTPYRVYNRLACNGCYNDPRVTWQENLCPRQVKGSDKIFECSKTITPRMVIAAIDRLLDDKSAGRA